MAVGIATGTRTVIAATSAIAGSEPVFTTGS
jgi:hypothetical protein